jgi:hypothetical protein
MDARWRGLFPNRNRRSHHGKLHLVVLYRRFTDHVLQLREFCLRFAQYLDLKRVILEKLEDFAEFDATTAKGTRSRLVQYQCEFE